MKKSRSHAPKTTFHAVLANTLTASLTNNSVWFAVTFWAYLETQSVLATSVMAGVYLGTVALSGVFLGSVVDRYKKKTSMLLSSAASLVLYAGAFLLYVATPPEVFATISSPRLWTFIILCLAGTLAGNVRSIALSTLVTILIPEPGRDKANGLVGTANGISFLVASIFSGLMIGFLGIYWMLVIALALTVLVAVHAWYLPIPENEGKPSEDHTKKIDLRGTVKAVRQVPGLFADLQQAGFARMGTASIGIWALSTVWLWDAVRVAGGAHGTTDRPV